MGQAGTKRVAIIGGGIMGVTLAYKLAQGGLHVAVYERGDNLGGLAGYLPYQGARLDRFYHTILSSDMSMQTLMKEGGVADKLHFTATQQGFYDKGHVYPFNTPVDFLLFPPLNLFQRFRLGLQVIYAQFESNWEKMDTLPVEDWLVRVSGRGVYNKVWKPLLRAKFDSTSENVPATYIWSRLRRMMGTREGVTSKEMMCYLENGYYTLIEALAQKAEALGVTFHLNAPVDEIVIEAGRATGLRRQGQVETFDAVISTLASPILSDLIPNAPPDFRALLARQQYLGVLCPLLILKQQLMPYYVLNITDDSIPFTAVVETTNLINPEHVQGLHLVYLPKYLAPDNDMANWPDEQVKAEWLKHFRRMFPNFDEQNIVDFIVQRAKYVEPIRPMGTRHEIPPVKTPVSGLYMGNTVLIYPELGNGEAVTRFAAQLATSILTAHSDG
ncbi:MAG TPA: NAD(P)/FAD-dependent oxidoreductase [Phototrophicaceae bacterium]|nr:NAD(P)/FAD-dependent oxidoreductase [Phototrophicaceae bacterium]